MTPRRLATLRQLERLAQLQQERDRMALAQTIAAETEAQQAAEGTRQRLETLTAWRSQLTDEAHLALDRYTWALEATAWAVDENLAACQALERCQDATRQSALALAGSHGRHDATMQRRQHLQRDQARHTQERQREYAIESWLGLQGGSS